MADRYHADDMAIFNEGRVPKHTWNVTYWPGQFYNLLYNATEQLLRIEGLDYVLHNFDWQEDDELHFPRLRLTFHADPTVFSVWFHFPDSKTVKRTKFRLKLETPNTVVHDLTVAVLDYELNDDETITFECQHPLAEWRQNAVSIENADTAVSNLVPNT